MGGPEEMPQGGIKRRDLLKGLASLGAMAAAPFLFSSLADARDCTGARCGNWHMKETPAVRRDPEEERRFKEDMNSTVSNYGNIQELLKDILTSHGVEASRAQRFTIMMSPPGRAIEFSVSENGTEVGSFIVRGNQLQMAYGVDASKEGFINKKGFQVLFFRGLQELRLPIQ